MPEAGEIAGYVYASPHRERAAYQWSVDVAAYVSADFHQHATSYLMAGLFECHAKSKFETTASESFGASFGGGIFKSSLD